MKDEARLVLDTLKKDNEELKKTGTDGSPDITPVRNYERRNVIQNDDGTWGETITEEESPVKKDIEQRDNELKGFETDAANYKNLAKIGDNKVIQIIDEINDKKLGILTTVNTAVSAGCTYFVGDGTKTSLVNSGPVTVGGVILGPANTQTVYNTDYPQLSNDKSFILTYDNLDNYQADAPFTGITSSTLTQNNVGTGFSTGCIVNTGAAIEAGGNTQFKIIKGTEGGACAGYLNTINTLASEIDALRDSLGTDWAAGSYVGVIKDTIDVKDMKTGSETMIWSYRNDDEESKKQQESNNSLINSIESQSEYQ
tara:strand:- start:20 stop:955 length:936 start_codon:yes stop_codon:yes gene_type:complete